MEGIDIRKINKLKKEIGLDKDPVDDIFKSYDIEDIKGIKLMHKNEPVLYFNNRREIVILNTKFKIFIFDKECFCTQAHYI